MKTRLLGIALLAAAPALLAQTTIEHHVTTVKEPDVSVSNVRVQEVRTGKSANLATINSQVNRLESILATTQDANLPQSSLMRVANEANMLASRIWSGVHRSMRRTDTMTAATQLRMHIREMRKAAASGDVAGVQMHAREALPYAYRIDERV